LRFAPTTNLPLAASVCVQRLDANRQIRSQKNQLFDALCTIRSNSIVHTLSPLFLFNMSTGDFRVADISLADFGRKEIELAEHEVCP
jgi:hypothetical protein